MVKEALVPPADLSLLLDTLPKLAQLAVTRRNKPLAEAATALINDVNAAAAAHAKQMEENAKQAGDRHGLQQAGQQPSQAAAQGGGATSSGAATAFPIIALTRDELEKVAQSDEEFELLDRDGSQIVP